MNVDDGFQSRQIVNGFISFMATTYFLIVLLYSSLSMTCLFILLFYYNSREDNQIVVYSFLLILRKLYNTLDWLSLIKGKMENVNRHFLWVILNQNLVSFRHVDKQFQYVGPTISAILESRLIFRLLSSWILDFWHLIKGIVVRNMRH